MQAVVLAGGLATRLGALTAHVPKYLLPVAGRPFAEWHLRKLSACGFTEVVLCVGHLAERIVDALGDGSDFGLRIRFALDGPVPQGTGVALRAALGLLQPSFLLTYGDSYLPFDYAEPLRELERYPEAAGCMAVYLCDPGVDRPNTLVSGSQVIAYAKAAAPEGRHPAGERLDEASSRHAPGDAPAPPPRFRHIDYGAMALRRAAVEAWCPNSGPRASPRAPAGASAEGPSDLGHLQSALATQGFLRALPVGPRFFEIGSRAGLAALGAELGREDENQPETAPR